jgi:hypothetical protein
MLRVAFFLAPDKRPSNVQWPSHLLPAWLPVRDLKKPHAGDVDLAVFLILCGPTGAQKVIAMRNGKSY